MTQEVFVRVYRQLDTCHGDGFMAWLLRITRNHCIDQIRRRKARPPAEDVLVDEQWTMADTASNLEQAWVVERRKQLVYDALRQLNGQNRKMILLKEIQGLALQEIADMLGLPLGMVKSRSNRARVELAKQVVALDPAYATVADRAEMN